ncbi:MAG TPA: hypothetical protein VK700_03085 [Steroidobacteraceae bacterium]|nr:hypothetical protein [Steroidobacteraceae bacterium]
MAGKQTVQHSVALLSSQLSHLNRRKTSTGAQQCIVDATDVRQVGGEDDLTVLCTYHAVGDHQESMQVSVAVGTRLQEVVRVFDDECIVQAGDEIHEDLIALQGVLVRGVHGHRAVLLAARHGRENRTNQPGLAHAGWPQQDQNRLGRRQITLDELRHGNAQLWIGFVHEKVVGYFIKGRVDQRAAAVAELPIDQEHLIAHAARTHCP